MPAEITVREDGFAEAAFALVPAWHGLGVVFDHAMSSREALEGAGLDWDVLQEQVFRQRTVTIETPEGPVERPRYDAVPRYLMNVRSDSGDLLGLVSEQYQIVQNRDAFAFLDGLIEEHQMEYESAFSLSGGRKVCMLGRLPRADEVVAGDKTLRYVLMSLHHDGTGAIHFGPTSVRVVCANTYAMALDEGYTRQLSIRHTGDVSQKLEQARAILQIAGEKFDQYNAHAKRLAARRLTRDEWVKFLDIMCPIPSSLDPDWTEDRERQIRKTRDGIEAAYRNERQMLAGIEETAWSAFCAVTEYVDHLPRRGATPRAKAEARFNVVLHGTGRDHKARAFETACRFAGMNLMAG